MLLLSLPQFWKYVFILFCTSGIVDVKGDYSWELLCCYMDTVQHELSTPVSFWFRWREFRNRGLGAGAAAIIWRETTQWHSCLPFQKSQILLCPYLRFAISKTPKAISRTHKKGFNTECNVWDNITCYVSIIPILNKAGWELFNLTE